MGLGQSYSSKYNTLSTPDSQYSYVNQPISNLDLSISTGLGIPPPVRPRDETDSQKIYAFYRSRNLLCIPAFIMLLIICLVLTIPLDAGLSDSWSAQGSNRFNDRHVPVSLLHKKTLHLTNNNHDDNNNNNHRHGSIITHWNQSISSTPAIWNGKVFATSTSGSVAAFHLMTGELIWSKNICKDVFGINPIDCPGYLQEEGKYYSVATPTIWGKDNIVVSIRKPATILVLESETGRVVSRATLDENPLTELTQSGTIYGDSIYIGTSISDSDALIDKHGDCTFVGKFFRWNLKEMRSEWSVKFDDSQLEFTGMRISGSSPPISVHSGLVVVSVGPAICTPTWYQNCIQSLNPDNGPFDSELYRSRNSQCHYQGTAGEALFNSIVSLDIETGAKVEWQKIIGYDAWSYACAGKNEHNWNCHMGNLTQGEDEAEERCDIRSNLYLNCHTEEDSWNLGLDLNDFVDDPVLTHPADGVEVIYFAQTSGIIYSYSLEAKDGTESLPSDSAMRRFLWATAVVKGSGNNHHTSPVGLAVDKGNVYVSIKNEAHNVWVTDDPLQNTTICGGWAALNRDSGIPVWYTSPSQPYCMHSYAAPSVTNDLLLVTSSFDVGPTKKGSVLGIETKKGRIVDQLENQDPFTRQGVSIHGRCMYTGSDGWELLGWCISKEDLIH